MAEIDFSKKLTAADDILLRELDGEAVILHLGDESYYGLNESGTRIWQLLVDSETIESAVQPLLEEFEVDESTLRSDITNLINSMMEKKMVTLS